MAVTLTDQFWSNGTVWSWSSADTAASVTVWANWSSTDTVFEPDRDGWRNPESERLAEEWRLACVAARVLLLESLAPLQREEFEREGWFHVETAGGSRRYRLAPGQLPRLVHGEENEYTFCIHPVGSFPAEDTTLAHKLMLETDEARFLRIANRSQAQLGLREDARRFVSDLAGSGRG